MISGKYTILEAAVTIGCDDGSSGPNHPFQSLKICQQFLFLQFAFVIVYPLSLQLHYSFGLTIFANFCSFFSESAWVLLQIT